MVALSDLKQVAEFEWEIPTSFREDMRVPVHIFATQDLLEQILPFLTAGMEAAP